LVHGGGEAQVGGVRDEGDRAGANLVEGAVGGGVIDDQDFGSGRQRGVEAGADFGLGVMGDNDDSDVAGHMSNRREVSSKYTLQYQSKPIRRWIARISRSECSRILAARRSSICATLGACALPLR